MRVLTFLAITLIVLITCDGYGSGTGQQTTPHSTFQYKQSFKPPYLGT